MQKTINLKNGNKIFNIGNEKIHALNSVNITIERGKMYAIMGHSGSGKSTLIQILGLLDNLSSGELCINGKDLKKVDENEKAEIRMNEIGFVFQSFYLNPRLKAIENVILPMYINSKINKKERNNRAKELLEKFGLLNRMYHYPKELSGGEQQFDILKKLSKEDKGILIVSHNNIVKDYADEVFYMENGNLRREK